MKRTQVSLGHTTGGQSAMTDKKPAPSVEPGSAPLSAEQFWYTHDTEDYSFGMEANHKAVFRFAEAYCAHVTASLREKIPGPVVSARQWREPKGISETYYWNDQRVDEHVARCTEALRQEIERLQRDLEVWRTSRERAEKAETTCADAKFEIERLVKRVSALEQQANYCRLNHCEREEAEQALAEQQLKEKK